MSTYQQYAEVKAWIHVLLTYLLTENHLCLVAGNTVWSHMTRDLTSALEVC